jgi:hypothetical protein
VVYRDDTRQAKGLYRLKHVRALESGLAYLSRYNSGWFCHMILKWISRPSKGKPNSHAWNIQRSFRSNHFPLIPGYGSGPPQATVGPYAHQLCRTYVCSTTTWSYSCLLRRTYSHTSVRVYNKNQIIEWWRHVHLPGQSGTRLTALPYFAACG